jgi:ABC-2 type transport system ATP-binding protein
MIQLLDVHKSYQGRTVLDGVTLEIPSHRVFGLLGCNGAGKTTTLNLILGNLVPDSGSVTVQGRTAYIPENVALYGELSGLENLVYFSALAGVMEQKDHFRRILLELGLASEALDRRAGTYSKGMRQRVAIAIALAKGANVLLLDEPTSGLDPDAVVALSQILRKVADQGGAVLLTTHDLWHLSLDCDEIAILHHGRITDQFPSSGKSANELSKRFMEGTGRACQ